MLRSVCVLHIWIQTWLLLFLLATPAMSQARGGAGGNPAVPLQFVTSDPAGACSVGVPMRYNTSNGKLWGCDAGTWTAIGGGGATPAGSAGCVQLYATANSFKACLDNVALIGPFDPGAGRLLRIGLQPTVKVDPLLLVNAAYTAAADIANLNAQYLELDLNGTHNYMGAQAFNAEIFANTSGTIGAVGDYAIQGDIQGGGATYTGSHAGVNGYFSLNSAGDTVAVGAVISGVEADNEPQNGTVNGAAVNFYASNALGGAALGGSALIASYLSDMNAATQTWAFYGRGTAASGLNGPLQLLGNVVNPFVNTKNTQAATAPGAGKCDVRMIAGTNAGTGKVVINCGTLATELTIIDNVGAAF